MSWSSSFEIWEAIHSDFQILPVDLSLPLRTASKSTCLTRGDATYDGDINIVCLTEPPKDRMIPMAIRISLFIIFLSQLILKSTIRVCQLLGEPLAKAQAADNMRTGRKNYQVCLSVEQYYSVNRVYLDFPTFGWIITDFFLPFGSLCFIKCSRSRIFCRCFCCRLLVFV